MGWDCHRDQVADAVIEAENCASHMPSLKAQEQGASEVATAALSRCNRFANSIRAFSETDKS